MNEERNVPESVTATDLARFEDQLRAQRAPAIEYLRSGLATAGGVKLPQEALTWFGWHDGVSIADPPARHRLGPFQLLALSDAIDVYRRRRQRAVAQGPEVEEAVWSRRWLPFATQPISRTLVIDICGPVDAPAPVYLVDAQDPEQEREPKCASLVAMVDLWANALTQGLWRWDHKKQDWDIADDSAVSGDAAAVVFG